MKFPEVAKYYVQPDMAMSGTDVLVFNKKAFDSLPKDIQNILDQAFRQRAYKRSADYEVEEVKALEVMKKDYKVTVTSLSPEDRKKLQQVAIKQWDKVAQKDADCAKAIAMLKTYLKKLGHID